MPVINTNYLSLVAQNNLTKSQNTLGSAIEKLSSGLRINSAKDDAAGQAIANRFTANVKGLTQAARNANDGISIAQTTEGALNEINNNLQRVRELTVQATNGTNSATDLQSIQDEITQRLEEIDRVSAQTQFNGVKVLASDQSLSIQVGANDNETISINLKKIDSATLGLASLDVTKNLVSQPALGKQVGFNEELGAIYEVKGADGAVVADQYAAKGTDGSLISVGVATAPDEVNGGFTAHTYNTGSGADKYATLQFTAVSATDFSNNALVVVGKNDAGEVVELTGDVDAPVDTDGMAASTSTFAKGGLSMLDNALSEVDKLRSNLGAVQNRFQSTIANLNNTVNNLSAARSRIEDADYATEVSNMSKAQILQQAGTSVLAQANQVPQSVLSLLQ